MPEVGTGGGKEGGSSYNCHHNECLERAEVMIGGKGRGEERGSKVVGRGRDVGRDRALVVGRVASSADGREKKKARKSSDTDLSRLYGTGAVKKLGSGPRVPLMFWNGSSGLL